MTDSNKQKPKRTLGTLSVIFLVYFNVCGGPLGSETVFSACGPLVGLISLLVFPTIWCLQTSLMTLELSSAFPENGGYSLWVQNAFGTFWGVQESYYSWISGVIDNALYPGLIFDSTKHLMTFMGNTTLPGSADFWDAYDEVSEDDDNVFFQGIFSDQGALEFGVRVTLCFLMAIPNMLFIDGFGTMLTVLCSISLLPYLAFLAMGVGRIEPSNLMGHNVTADGFGDLVQVVFWNMNGFDCISTSMGEVKSPTKTVAIGLLVAGVLTLLTYLLPLLVSGGINRPPWQEGWDDGYFSVFAYEIGGIWLSGAIVVGTIMAGVGLYVTEMFEDSFQIQGMAEAQMAPACLACRHKTRRTPINAILVNLVLILLLQPFDVNTIITYTNVVNCASVVLELAALVWLRIKQPDLPRPFRIPMNTWQLVLFLLPSLLMALYIIISGMTGSLLMFGVNLCALLFGIVPYLILRWSQKRAKKNQSSSSDDDSSSDSTSRVETTPFLETTGELECGREYQLSVTSDSSI